MEYDLETQNMENKFREALLQNSKFSLGADIGSEYIIRKIKTNYRCLLLKDYILASSTNEKLAGKLGGYISGNYNEIIQYILETDQVINS